MKNKYFIAIVPPEPLQGELMQFKEYVAEKFNSSGALRSPAHITLHMPFELEGKKEERLLEEFPLLKAGNKPFDVLLNGFDFFEPRVVFVNVEPSVELLVVRDRVLDFMKRGFHIFNQSDDLRGFHPHITIAFRDLRKPQFFLAKDEFAAKKFQAKFLCSDVCLLKHDGKRWSVVSRATI